MQTEATKFTQGSITDCFKRVEDLMGIDYLEATKQVLFRDLAQFLKYFTKLQFPMTRKNGRFGHQMMSMVDVHTQTKVFTIKVQDIKYPVLEALFIFSSSNMRFVEFYATITRYSKAGHKIPSTQFLWKRKKKSSTKKMLNIRISKS